MNRILLALILLPISFRVYAQLSVEQLEAQWESYYKRGQFAFDNMNYQMAENCFVSSIDLLSTNNATNSLYHIYSLIKLGEIYNIKNQSNKLKDIKDEILNIRSRLRPNSKSYINYLYSLSVFYSNIGDFDNAERIINETLKMNDMLSNMGNLKSELLHRMALCHYFKGDLDLAISVEKECIQHDQKKAPDYITSLVYYYCQNKEWGKLEECLPDCFIQNREAVLRNFVHSKKNNRAISWATDGLFFTDFIPYYLANQSSDVLKSYAYDAALFSKGILLAAENKSIEITLNSRNPELIETYNHYTGLKSKKKRTIEEDIELQTLSDVFLRYQKEHKNEFREDFRIGWRKVQSQLREKDIAIEFIILQKN